MKYLKPITLLLIILLNSVFTNSIFALKCDENQQIKEDMAIVWPLTQIVKTEYTLAKAQLEFCKNLEEKEAFLEAYEIFIKENYFKQVLSLNLRQGKLLLLLIDREIGETPFDLLKEYLSLNRAIFWQRFAKLIDANLKEKYLPEEHPLIENEIQLIRLNNPII